MKTIEISYNPYRMITKILIDGIDVCQNDSYNKFKEFIENEIPLQTWIEPIQYLGWKGIVNEVSDPEYNDEVNLVFSGREIDFADLQRSIKNQNAERSEETRVVYHYVHKKVLDDNELSNNIEYVVNELKSERFRELVSQRTTEGLTQKYEELDENYTIAKETVFYIVLAGVYSSGKSTLLNALIRHDILPTSSRTCTSKNCRIRHDGSLGTKIALAGYGAKSEENGIEPVIIEKKIYDTDEACAAAFLEICPIQETDTGDSYPDLETMEIGVDLSHLYPKSVNEENFTIVLIDTPGMDSAQSSEDGSNKHAEIALEAISMESKPMIILCVDASYYDNKSIGEFMREIIAQAQKEGSGFNDRFLFLMNKSDSISYNQNETAEEAKATFAQYLTNSSKWGINGNDEELKQLAEEASHFVPRVFMTAGRIAFAIQCKAYNFMDEELEDKDKYDLLEKYESFEKKICGRRKLTDCYLSRYCDIPNYRKDEIEVEFKQALDKQDNVRATELQCGLVSVESAIKDYIERYAYPIKVRGLLETFEDILEDVNGFTIGVLGELKKAQSKLGEENRERGEASKRKEGANEKIAALEEARRETDEQLKALDNIQFDSNALRRAMTEFRADIESSDEIRFIRDNQKVETGQKSRDEVEKEIDSRVANIKEVFDCALQETNKKLEEIKSVHDEQILEIFGLLKDAVARVEQSGVFKHGEYKFTDSVLWKMNFANINSDNFAPALKNTIVDSKILKRERNRKKEEWRSSWNPFKKIGSWFMSDYEIVLGNGVDYYENTDIRKSIDDYLHDLERERINMENNFKEIMEESKKKVRDLTDRLLREITQFLDDINKQEARIEELSNSIPELEAEVKKSEETVSWLNNLKEKIEGDK